VPKRSDCWRMRAMMSWPLMPSGKAGKFSMSVVVVSWPPGTARDHHDLSKTLAESAMLCVLIRQRRTPGAPAAMPPARKPSKRSGFMLARAA